MAIGTARRRLGVRGFAVVVGGVILVSALSGCAVSGGRASRTLLEGAVQTQQEVKSLLSNIPAEWLQGDATDVPMNDYSYCGSVIDTGPSGSAAWSYGLGHNLAKPMSNAEVLKLLAPSGDQWVLRPEQSVAGIEKDPSIVDLDYDGPDMTVHIRLNAENETMPRIAVDATTWCIPNGDTGPETFEAPTSVPGPSTR